VEDVLEADADEEVDVEDDVVAVVVVEEAVDGVVDVEVVALAGVLVVEEVEELVNEDVLVVLVLGVLVLLLLCVLLVVVLVVLVVGLAVVELELVVGTDFVSGAEVPVALSSFPFPLVFIMTRKSFGFIFAAPTVISSFNIFPE